MSEKEVVLEARNLSVDFRVDRHLTLHAVRDVSFVVHQGETLGILGESGCGKSVTCMSILRLNPPRTTTYPQGQILYGGQDLLKISDGQMRRLRGDKIAMIFQEPMTAMNPFFTIGDQMRESVRIHHKKISKQEAEDMCEEALNKVRIPNPKRVMDSYSFALSGGMLQRVMIAMAMINKPDLLICDEPTTALDVTIQAQVLDLMNQLKQYNDTAIIFVTHDLGVISEMADRCMVMYGGRKCEEAPTDDLFENPQHPYTKGLIDSHPTSDYTGDRLKTIPGSVPSLKEMPAGCPFNNRCPYQRKECLTTMPDLVEVSAGHYSACPYMAKEVEA